MTDDDDAGAVIREIISAVPTGCSWLRPVTGPDGQITDFVVAAVSEREGDVYGRGAARVGRLLTELYPGIVGTALWRLYCRAALERESTDSAEYRHAEQRAGVVADSRFEVSVHPVLGGLLVMWHRTDEAQRRLRHMEELGNLGWSEYDLSSGRVGWSPGMYRLFHHDPALGPLSRTDQAARILPEDRGRAETAWQELDSGGVSDTTVRFRLGERVTRLRILSEVARDAAGNPVKIYAVVQDVTAREDSRTTIERLSDQLRTREMTALAEHRLAAQVQHLIQPVPREPFALAGLHAVVNYLPAESTVQVGGDWYHARTLPGGQVALAVGDVTGHGLDAANGMAHLRFSLIAWLSIGILDPGELLVHMNRLCLQLRITATAAVAVYDPQTRTLAWARAGHLPPLLARDGATSELDHPKGLLLGADAGSRYPVLTPRLKPDDLVLFYTDGLIERRASGMLGTVVRHLSAVSADPGPDPLVRLRDLLHQASPYDDTCMLAVRVTEGAGEG
jgi:serine phosphatase RsbU (regulator of sigma subunit)